VCGGLALVLVGLVAYQLYSLRPRRTDNPELLRRLEQQTITQADDRPLDPKSWPQWRGAKRDGVTTAPDLLTDWPEGGPKELWRVKGGDGYSSFAVAGDVAYTMAALDGKQYVIALNLATGKRLWETECGDSKRGDHGDFAGPRSTPTLDGDRLYVLSSWGVLLCLTTDKGEVVWEADLVKDHGGRLPRWGFATSPLVEGDLVFVMPGGNKGKGLAAFDKRGDGKSGKLVWSAENDVAGYSSPIAATIGGVRQIIYLTGYRLVGVTPGEGKLLWEYPWADRFNVNAATPVLVRAKEGEKEDSYVFVSSGYQKGCALVKVAELGGGRFEAQRVYESNEVCCHFGSPVLAGKYLYAPDETRDLTCLDVRTGDVTWRVKGRDVAFAKASVLRVDDRLIVLGEQGQLALVECDGEQFRQLARCRPFRGRCWTMPVLAGGRLLLRDQGEIVCLDVRSVKAP
jgi:outer membrane protein assembly factor BamB